MTESVSDERSEIGGGALLPYLIAAAFFMEYLDTTVIATSLPAMSASFGVEPSRLSVGMSAYMLTLAALIPVSGWVADCFGSRTVFAGAVAVFIAASMLCGMSGDITSFTGARILQGLGGSMMVPVGRMIVVRNTDKRHMMKAIATMTWPAIVAPVVGPTIGGLITTFASWRWIFFLNFPFGILLICASLKFVPNQRNDRRERFDVTGFILCASALVSLLYGAELASRKHEGLVSALLFLSMGMGLGFLAYVHLGRVEKPLLSLSSFRIPTFSAATLWGGCGRIALESPLYLLPLLFQVGLKYSAFHSGLLLLAAAAGNIGMKAFTIIIFRRFGFRSVALIDGLLAALTLFAMGFLDASSPVAMIAFTLLLFGLTRSLLFSLFGTLAYADINEREKGPASIVFSVVQQMGLGLGIALGAICLRVAPSSVSRLEPGYGLADFRFAFAVDAAIVLVSLIGFLRLPADAGSQLGVKSRPR